MEPFFDEEMVIVVEDHENTIHTITLFKEHNRIVTSSDDRTVRIFTLDEFKCLKILNFDKQLDHLIKWNEETFLFCTFGGQIQAFSVTTFKMVRDFNYSSSEGFIYKLLKVSDENFIVINHSDQVFVYSFTEGMVVRQLKDQKLDSSCCMDVSLTYKDCFYLTTTNYDQEPTFSMINWKTNKIEKLFRFSPLFDLNGPKIDDRFRFRGLESLFYHDSGSMKKEIIITTLSGEFLFVAIFESKTGNLLKEVRFDNEKGVISSFLFLPQQHLITTSFTYSTRIAVLRLFKLNQIENMKEICVMKLEDFYMIESMVFYPTFHHSKCQVLLNCYDDVIRKIDIVGLKLIDNLNELSDKDISERINFLKNYVLDPDSADVFEDSEVLKITISRRGGGGVEFSGFFKFLFSLE